MSSEALKKRSQSSDLQASQLRVVRSNVPQLVSNGSVLDVVGTRIEIKHEVHLNRSQVALVSNGSGNSCVAVR